MIAYTSTTHRDASTFKDLMHWRRSHRTIHYNSLTICTSHATISDFLAYIYIPEAASVDISDILSAQLDEMQQAGALSSANNHTSSMIAHPLLGTHLTTYLEDKHIILTMSMTSRDMEGVPHAYIVTTLTFATTTYGLTLLASK